MANSTCGSTEPRSTRTSLAVFNAFPSVINRDSKAQHILGLSRTGLDYARHETLKSTSTLDLHHIPLPESIRTRLARAGDRSSEISNIEVTAVSESGHLLHTAGSSDTDSIRLSQNSSIYRPSSTSTLRSIHDAAFNSRRISQQTSTSPTLDFSPSTAPSRATSAHEQQMDCGQRRFFKFSKPRNDGRVAVEKASSDTPRDQVVMIESRRSGFLSPRSKSPFVTRVSPVSPLTTTTSLARQSNEKIAIDRQRNRATLRKKNVPEPKIVEKLVPNVTVDVINTPYAKVNIRRPKTNNRHWFDDLEGLSSEDDDYEPDFKPYFDSEFGHDFVHEFEISPTEFPQPIRHSRRSSQPRTPKQVKILEEPELLVKPISPIFYRPHRQQNTSQKDSVKTSNARAKEQNPLVKADLSQDSVLNLSTSEDERDDEEAASLPQYTRSLGPALPIRQSVAEGMNDDSDVEIGLAHTVKSSGRKPGRRPAPIRIISSRGQSPRSPSPITPPPWQPAPKSGSLGSTSTESDESEVREVEEDVLLRSFPATPVDANRPRSSISISDDRSIMSMRMMKVTKQEENLIAAMRIKRAAMKRDEKAAARRNTSRFQEERHERVNAPERQSSLIDTPRSSVDANRPVTAFVPDSNGRGSSEIPLLVEFRDTCQIRDSSSTYPKRKSSSASRASYGPFPRLQSSIMSTSSADSMRRDSNLIVLDNLNSELPKRIFPAQLYMESPFASWGKTDISTVH